MQGANSKIARKSAGLGLCFLAMLLASTGWVDSGVAVAGSLAPVTALVSRATGNGEVGDGNSLRPSISADGRFVAFESRAGNLGGSAPAGKRVEIYVRDMSAKTTTLVSRANGSSGDAADCDSREPSISGDARYVAFSSCAKNLGAKTDGVYVRDLTTGTTSLVSREGNEPSISADGRHLAFSAPDTSGASNLYVEDLDSGVTELVSRAGGPEGAAGPTYSAEPSISAEGRYVAFVSSDPLTPDDVDQSMDYTHDVFVRDRVAGTTTLVSRATGIGGAASELDSEYPSISADGRYVAFWSDAKLSGDKLGDGRENLYVRDLTTGVTTAATPGDEPKDSGSARVGANLGPPSISSDGRYVAFEAGLNGLTEVDTPDRQDLFVRDMQQGLTVNVSRASGKSGAPGDGPSFHASISADGRYVAFDSRATNLDGADGNGFSDVFRRQPVYAKEAPLRTGKCAGRDATITGTPGADSINGTKYHDVILALGGDDVINSQSGGDLICAGPGRDRVDAGSGGEGRYDLVLGGPGADVLSLGPECGTLKGQGGNDVLIGSSEEEDALYGGAGNDTLHGGGGGDFLFGGSGNDSLFGGPGPDQLSGGSGHNHLASGKSVPANTFVSC